MFPHVMSFRDFKKGLMIVISFCMIKKIYVQQQSNQLIDNQVLVLIVNSLYAHVFIRCKLLSSDLETMILQMFVRISVCGCTQ